jgi:hypothetical protein
MKLQTLQLAAMNTPELIAKYVRSTRATGYFYLQRLAETCLHALVEVADRIWACNSWEKQWSYISPRFSGICDKPNTRAAFRGFLRPAYGAMVNF